MGRWLEGRLRAEMYKFQHRALLSSGGLRAPRAAGLGQRWGAGHAGPADRPAGGKREGEPDSGPDSAQLPLGMGRGSWGIHGHHEATQPCP